MGSTSDLGAAQRRRRALPPFLYVEVGLPGCVAITFNYHALIRTTSQALLKRCEQTKRMKRSQASMSPIPNSGGHQPFPALRWPFAKHARCPAAHAKQSRRSEVSMLSLLRISSLLPLVLFRRFSNRSSSASALRPSLHSCLRDTKLDCHGAVFLWQAVRIWRPQSGGWPFEHCRVLRS